MKVKTVMLIFFGLMLMCSVGSASVSINNSTTFPYTMNVAGETYVLTENVSSSGTALIVGASNITLNGNGYNIAYATLTDATAITNSGYDNVNISNLNIIHSNSTFTLTKGIHFSGGSNNFILNNVSVISPGSCIYGDSSTSTIINCTTSSNVGTGFVASACSYLYNSTFNGTQGINLVAGAQNSVISNCSAYTSGNGIMLNGVNNVTVRDSIASSANSTGFYVTTTSASFVTNVSASSDLWYALALGASTNNTFVSCTAVSQSLFGLYVSTGCVNNTFNECVFRSTEGIATGLFNSSSYFNSSVSISPYANTDTSMKHRVLAVGDSITQGGADPSTVGGYTPYVSSYLGSSYVCSNQGVGGDLANKSVISVQSKLDLYDPDTVIILIGTNDIAAGRSQQDIIDDIITIADISKASGATPIICTILPRSAYIAEIKTLNAELIIQANSAGYNVINTYDSIDSTPYNMVYDNYVSSYYLDGVHIKDPVNAVVGQHIARNILGTSSIYVGTGLNQTIGFSGEVLSNSRDVYSTDTPVPFSIVPTEDWVRINITTWETNHKVWTEDMDSHDGTTTHVLGNFPANTDIDIYRDGIDYDTVRSNSTGYITWVYDGGFSEHTFEAIPHATAGVRDSFVSSWGNTVSMVGAVIVIALAGSAIAVFRGKRDISDVVNDLPGIVLIVVLLIVGAIIFGQF